MSFDLSRGFPPVSKELLDAIKAAYPNKIPTSPTFTVDDFRRLQGQQTVINFLQSKFDEQNLPAE